MAGKQLLLQWSLIRESKSKHNDSKNSNVCLNDGYMLAQKSFNIYFK